MSISHGGVEIYYYSFSTQKFGSFANKSTAAAELNVSNRTITRWADSCRVSSTRTKGFEKVVLGYTLAAVSTAAAA